MSISVEVFVEILKQGGFEGGYSYTEDDQGIAWDRVRYGLKNGKVIGDYTLTVADEYGGEGGGDTLFVVVRVADSYGDETFFRKDGYYASYDGSNWDGDLRAVKPEVRTITVYEAPAGPNYDPLNSFGDDDSYGGIH